MSNQCCKELTAKIRKWIKQNTRGSAYTGSQIVYTGRLLDFLDELTNRVVGIPTTSANSECKHEYEVRNANYPNPEIVCKKCGYKPSQVESKEPSILQQIADAQTDLLKNRRTEDKLCITCVTKSCGHRLQDENAPCYTGNFTPKEPSQVESVNTHDLEIQTRSCLNCGNPDRYSCPCVGTKYDCPKWKPENNINTDNYENIRDYIDDEYF